MKPVVSPCARIELDPAFVEEAVFLTLKREEKAGGEGLVKTFHDGKNQIYEVVSGETREESFRKFYKVWFSKLGLGVIFERIVGEFPLLAGSEILVFVKRVFRQKDEGSELYVEDFAKTVLIGLQVIRILDKPFLEAILRQELVHVSDMLDPEFQYSPDPIFGGTCETENDLIRDRFAVLWNLYVSSRIQRKGFQSLVSRGRQKLDFDKTFSFWSEKKRNQVFEDLLNRDQWTHPELLRLARHRDQTRISDRGWFRCPLCSFSSYESVDCRVREAAAVVKRIEQDREDWEPERGVCQQCFAIYRSKLGVSV